MAGWTTGVGLVVRYDRHTDVYIAFLIIACFMTTLSKILG